MERFSLLRGALPPAFELRALELPPGRTLAYDEKTWSGALVVVECGEIELECLQGARRRFGCGSVLCLAGLDLRAVHNCGREPALLAAVWRRR